MPLTAGRFHPTRREPILWAMKIFARKDPWYLGGLAFQCQQCGRCCEGPEEGYVWVTDEEIAAIAAHLGLTEAQMRRRYVRQVARRYSLVEQKGSRDCIFLQTDSSGRRRCRIYPVRPVQCRTWPFWPSNLSDPDTWAEAGRRCRGINCGELVDYNEVEARRRATDE